MKKQKMKVKKYRRGKDVIVFTQVEAIKTKNTIYSFVVENNEELTKYLLDSTKSHIIKEQGLYHAKEALFSILKFYKKSKKLGKVVNYLEYKESIKERGLYSLFSLLNKNGYIPLEEDIQEIIRLSVDYKEFVEKGRFKDYVASCLKCKNTYTFKAGNRDTELNIEDVIKGIADNTTIVGLCTCGKCGGRMQIEIGKIATNWIESK